MDLYPLIAERLRQNVSVVDEALHVLDRWDAMNTGPAARRITWRRLLLEAKSSPAGRDALLAILLDTSEGARRLKDFAPFAGILSREERRKAFLPCTYDH